VLRVAKKDKGDLGRNRRAVSMRGIDAAAAVAAAVISPYTNSALVPRGNAWRSEAVSVAKPFDIRMYDVSSLTGHNASWGLGGAMLATSRHPMLATQYITPIPTGGSWTYNAQFYTPPEFLNTATPPTMEDKFGNITDFVIQTKANPLGGAPQLSDLPLTFPELHGLIPAFGTPGYGPFAVARHAPGNPDEKYFWIDASAVHFATLVFSTYLDTVGTPAPPFVLPDAGHPMVVNLYMYGYTEPVGTALRDNTVNYWTSTINVERSGFYRFAYTSVDYNDDLYLRLAVSGSHSTLRTDPMPGFDARAAELNNVTTVGSSAMVSPMCARMNKGGVVVGLRVPDGRLPSEFIPYGLAGSITSPALATSDHIDLEGDDGMYAWMKPLGDTAFEPMEPFQYATNRVAVQSTTLPEREGSAQVIKYRVPIHPPDGWIAIFAQAVAPPAGTTYYAGATWRFTVAHSYNFVTRSTWYSSRRPPNVELATLASGYLDDVPFAMDNPFHLSDIKKFIARHESVLSHAAKYFGGVAGTALGSLVGAPELGVLGGDLASRAVSRLAR
jgi:hypothetical protein